MAKEDEWVARDETYGGGTERYTLNEEGDALELRGRMKNTARKCKVRIEKRKVQNGSALHAALFTLRFSILTLHSWSP
jgi:hypothetical protein